MITAISIDDEPHAHNVIKHHTSKIDHLELVETFTSPLEAADFIKKNAIDLLFLDINMPDMDGISLLETLKNPPTVIFTTAYEEYAVKSYDYEAAGYLLKPIEFTKFYEAVMRVWDQHRMSSRGSAVNNTYLKSTLLLKSGSKMLKFNPDNILYIKASGNYSKVYLKKEKVLVDHTLSELIDEHLPAKFIRIHRSFIINMDHLEEYESHQIKVEETTLPVGKTYRNKVRSYLSSL